MYLTSIEAQQYHSNLTNLPKGLEEIIREEWGKSSPIDANCIQLLNLNEGKLSIKVNFSALPILGNWKKKYTPEKICENNQIVYNQLLHLLKIKECIKQIFDIELVIEELDLSKNPISGKSLMGVYEEDKEFNLLKQFIAVKNLNFSYTKISSAGLAAITNLLPQLESLTLNRCIKITNFISEAMKPLLNLKNLSLHKTKVGEQLEKINEYCPNLISYIFSQESNNDKFLGIKDPIYRDTIRNPVVLIPCGHTFAKENLQILSQHGCSLCRVKVEKAVKFPSLPLQLTKEISEGEEGAARWTFSVLDSKGNKIEEDDNLYLHIARHCHQLFTEKALVNDKCPTCESTDPDELIRVFISTTEDNTDEASLQQNSLENLGIYVKPASSGQI